MALDVAIKNGRLTVREGGRLVIEKGGDFVDADTDGTSVLVVTASGRVQLLRPDGRFEKDISTTGAIGARFRSGRIVVSLKSGRTEEFQDGRMVRSY